MRKFLIYNLQWVIVVALCATAFADTFTEAGKDYIYGDYQDSLYKAGPIKNDSRGMYLIGLNYLKMNNYPAARAAFKKVTQSPDRSIFVDQARIKYADTYFLERDFARAKKEYLALKNTSAGKNFMPLVYLRLAQMCSKEGDWAGKRAYLNKIKSEYPGSAEMKYVRLLESYGDYFTVQVGAFSSFDNAQALVAEVFEQFGVSTTSMPGSDIYPALEKGTIDAADYVGPAINWDLGFSEVTKYIICMGPPGQTSLYQPVDLMDLTVNMGAWKRLSKKMQTFVEEQVQTYSLHHFVTIQHADLVAMDKFLKAGTTVSRLSADDVDKFRRAAIPVWFNWAKKNADATRVFKLQLDYMLNPYMGYVSPKDVKGLKL